MAEQMFEIETEYVKGGTVAEEDALFNYVIEKMNLVMSVDPAGRWPANRVRASVVRTSDAYGVQYSF
jgi:hypothetical protein